MTLSEKIKMLGFSVEPTGGGCSASVAYIHTVNTSFAIVLTVNDGSAYEPDTFPLGIGLYFCPSEFDWMGDGSNCLAYEECHDEPSAIAQIDELFKATVDHAQDNRANMVHGLSTFWQAFATRINQNCSAEEVYRPALKPSDAKVLDAFRTIWEELNI